MAENSVPKDLSIVLEDSTVVNPNIASEYQVMNDHACIIWHWIII